MHEPGALRWQFCKRKRNKERMENRKGKNLRTEGRKAGMCGRVSVGACGGAYIRVCMSVDRQKKHGIKKAKTKTAIKETHSNKGKRSQQKRGWGRREIRGKSGNHLSLFFFQVRRAKTVIVAP